MYFFYVVYRIGNPCTINAKLNKLIYHILKKFPKVYHEKGQALMKTKRRKIW